MGSQDNVLAATSPSGHGRTRKAGGGRRACAVKARKVEVHRPSRMPPAARLHPLLTLFVAEDAPTVSEIAPLHALFALLDEVGAAEVYRRTAARTSWRLVESKHPHVALRLEISAPSGAEGVVEVTMDVEDYRQVWQEVRGGGWVGITSSKRLHRHEDGSEADLGEAFAACIALESTPPPELDAMTHAKR